MVSQFLLIPVCISVAIRENSLSPFFQRYDRILVEKMTYRFRSPQRGEIVYYLRKKFVVVIPQALEDITFVLHESKNFERVVGMPGETVEWKNRTLYVNGKEMDKKYYPLITHNLPDHLYFEVPPDTYLVFITYMPQETFLNLGGNRAPLLRSPGVRFEQSFFDAFLVRNNEIIGRALCLYNPPVRRKWLTTD